MPDQAVAPVDGEARPAPADGQARPRAAGEGRSALVAVPVDRVPLRLILFAAALVLVLLGGFGLGRLTSADGAETAGAADAGHVHPPGAPAHSHAAVDSHDSHGATATNDPATTTAGQPAGAVGGLAVSVGDLALAPLGSSFEAGQRQPFRFQIRAGATGTTAVTTFAVVHDQPLHLIVVRRDLSGYQHLHPTMAPDGTWSVDLTLPTAGVWRAYADFTAIDAAGAQTPTTLGTDLTVSGDYQPQILPAPANSASVADFTVGFAGTPTVGVIQPLLFTVARGGSPAPVERYLGAYGHLVVLREGDLGYVHVHPEEQLIDDAVKFWLAAPSVGRYRAFFDFKVAGTVHTAAFTITIS